MFLLFSPLLVGVGEEEAKGLILGEKLSPFYEFSSFLLLLKLGPSFSSFLFFMFMLLGSAQVSIPSPNLALSFSCTSRGKGGVL